MPTASSSGVGRVTRGTLANGVRQMLTVAGQLVLVPVFLKYWGSLRYGEWQTLSAAVAYMTLLDFGMQSYVANLLNQSRSRGDAAEFTRVLHSALRFSVQVCAGGVVLLGLALLLFPLDRWLHLRVTDPLTVLSAAGLLGLYTIVTLPLGVFGGVYRAMGEYAVDINMGNALRFAVLAGTAVIVVCGGGFGVLAGSQLGLAAALLLLVLWDLRRRHPEIDIGLRKGDAKLARSFLFPSSLFLLMQMSFAMAVQGSTLLVGAALGATAVATFTSLRTLVNVIPQVTGTLSTVLWPEFTALEATGRYSALRQAHVLIAKLMLSFCLCAGLFVHFCGPVVVALWTRGRIRYDAPLVDALLLLQAVVVWYSTSALILGSSNNHKRLAMCYAASGCFGPALGYFLVSRFGAAGVGLGLLTAEILTSGWIVPALACRLLDEGPLRFASEVAGRGALVLALLYPMTAFLSALPAVVRPAERLLGFAVILGILGPVLTYSVWLNGSERGRVRALLRQLLLLAVPRSTTA